MLHFNPSWKEFQIIFVFLHREQSKIQMNKIKQVLEARGVKQTWLAEQLGKSVNMVNSYAQNHAQPSLSTLYKIANLLNVEVEDLIYSKEELAKIKSK